MAPLYSYKCQKCGKTVERVVKYEHRDNPWTHDDECGGKLSRGGLELCHFGKETYQCKAILGNGAHIPGHFGKEAKRRRR